MSEHVNCGGTLVYSHKKKTKAGNKTITKNMHKCSKCGAMINVILMQSYEEMVLSGQIRVSKQEYYRIKNMHCRDTVQGS